LFAFDDIIDARSPGEFAEDRVPGAINLPVLDDAERARVGTLYKQVSPFDAKKVGAALVSRNIAAHLDAFFADKPKSYRPLVYCWRGGSRSGAMTHILQKIGFGAVQLDGGYKAYRRHVVTELERLPGEFTYRVVAGPTGSGKSRLLAALADAGAQVVDLEGLAAHRGSLLGALPATPQPTQKAFESNLWQALLKLDPARPVYIESESKKIGELRVPEPLIVAMRASPCVRLDVAMDARVGLLLDDYQHFFADPGLIKQQLGYLAPLRGGETVAHWQSLADAGAWRELARALLVEHYDPAYFKSLARNFAARDDDQSFKVDDLGAAALVTLVQALV
jgi:tRNA 2-selenouridine synthase